MNLHTEFVHGPIWSCHGQIDVHILLISMDKLQWTNDGQIQFVHGQFGHTFVHDLVMMDKFRRDGQIEFVHGQIDGQMMDK